jgi:hypothetical protein
MTVQDFIWNGVLPSIRDGQIHNAEDWRSLKQQLKWLSLTPSQSPNLSFVSTWLPLLLRLSIVSGLMLQTDL